MGIVQLKYKKEREKEWDRRNISRNNSQAIPKLDERHNFTDSGSLNTPQQDTYKENHTYTNSYI